MKYVFLLIMLSLCLGCASTPAPKLNEISPKSLVKENWTSYGVLSINAPEGSLILNYEWKRTQHGKKTYARFSKMMGMLSSEIEFTDDMVRITFVDGTVETMINEPQVVGKVLNKKFYLPLIELNYWLVGEMAPEHLHSVTHNNDGTINTIKQAGWTTTFDEYKVEKDYIVPKRIMVYNYEEKIRIKIAVHGISIE